MERELNHEETDEAEENSSVSSLFIPGLRTAFEMTSARSWYWSRASRPSKVRLRRLAGAVRASQSPGAGRNPLNKEEAEKIRLLSVSSLCIQRPVPARQKLARTRGMAREGALRMINAWLRLFQVAGLQDIIPLRHV